MRIRNRALGSAIPGGVTSAADAAFVFLSFDKDLAEATAKVFDSQGLRDIQIVSKGIQNAKAMADELSDMSQGERAFATLMQAIETGSYKPGDRLREIEVADRLSLSRTPVREALRRLEAENIIEHRPRVGAVIRTLGQTEVVELYEMRLVLERTAAEMAAKYAASAEVDALAEINDDFALAVEGGPKAAAINQRFHKAIYTAARNRFLIDAARAINNALLLLGPTTLADKDRVSTVVRQHTSIIDAIEKGDVEAAGAAAEEHLQASLRHRLKVMRL